MRTVDGVEVLTTLEEIASPTSSCLLVYDAMNFLLKDTPRSSEILAVNPHFIENASRLVGSAAERGVPIVYTRHVYSLGQYPASYLRYVTEHLVQTPDKSRSSVGRPYQERLSQRDNGVIDELLPPSDAIVFDKTFSDAFTGTAFQSILRRLGVDTIVMAGIATDAGIENTARMALPMGYYTVVVDDAVSSSSRERHANALNVLSRVGVVGTTSQVCTLWT